MTATKSAKKKNAQADTANDNQDNEPHNEPLTRSAQTENTSSISLGAAKQIGVDEKEVAIIAAARQTFLAKGFDAASMDTIALSANVSKRTVYNRFRSKEELFAASILETCRKLLPINLDEIENSAGFLELLHSMASQILHEILKPEAIALRRIAGFEASRTPALGKAYLENGPRMMVRSFIPLLERLALRNKVNIDDHELALWQLGSLVTEPLYTDVLMGQSPENMEAAIQEQLQSGLDAFCKLYCIS